MTEGEIYLIGVAAWFVAMILLEIGQWIGERRD